MLRYLLGVLLAIIVVGISGMAFAQTPWPPGATAVYYGSNYNCEAKGVSCGGPYNAGALYEGGGQMGNCCIGQNYGSQWFGGDTITNNVFNAGNGYFHDGTGGPGLLSANGLFAAQIVNGELRVYYTAHQLGITASPYPTWKKLWGSGTSDGGPKNYWGTYAVVQNGSFTMLTQQDNPVANNVLMLSIYSGGNAAKLVLQNSGDLQLLDANNVILWHTNTASSLVSGNIDLTVGSGLMSVDGRMTVKMQVDGNLVVYDQNNSPLWASGTNYNPVSALARMQSDGNLVVYHFNGTTWSPVWATNTVATNTQSVARIENGGNFRVLQMINGSWSVAWATNTGGH
jgi:hypothetical protein